MPRHVIDGADDLVAENERELGLGELSVHDVEVGSAYPTTSPVAVVVPAPHLPRETTSALARTMLQRLTTKGVHMKKRVLVVCYSRGGTTLRVATHLAEALDADLDTIEESAPRPGLGGYVRSALEAVGKGLPAIRTREDPRDYDLVVIGTPVWVGTIASPVRSYLFSHPGQLRNAGFFAVMGGRGAEATLHEMQVACGASHAPTCALTQAEVEHDKYRRKTDRFIQALRDSLSGAEVRRTATA